MAYAMTICRAGEISVLAVIYAFVFTVAFCWFYVIFLCTVLIKCALSNEQIRYITDSAVNIIWAAKQKHV